MQAPRSRCDAQRGPATGTTTFELTVTGTLGPILRQALSSQAESQTQTCTIVRADVHDAIDLVDLVHVLDAHGLRVDGIYRLDG